MIFKCTLINFLYLNALIHCYVHKVGITVSSNKILQKKKKHRDKKRDKDKEVQASLMVACLKRLLPVGLNLFAGREQELVQHCKDRFLKVSHYIG